MNPNLPDSPEGRLLDELLHEQNQAPDEAFLQQIEAAIDAGSVPAAQRPSGRAAYRIAIAAGIALTASAGIWWQSHGRKPSAPELSMAANEQAEFANEQAASSLKELNQAVRDQEDKVEERRKVLATMTRTKGINYKGSDSFYGTSDETNHRLADNTREEATRRGLDAQDYVDAKREFETDQGQLMSLKLKQIELSTRLGTELPSDDRMLAMDSEVKQQRRIVPAPSSAPGASISLPEAEPAPQVSGDRYGTFIDQPWKTSVADPLSTFSIDVDTASYGNVRRMIREGREIPRDAVRIEECINAFSYHYQKPQGNGPFAVGASVAVCPWATDHQLVRVAIKGREIDADKRPASNLVFLIDVSGSMQSPDKLPLLKQSMATLVGQLDERDRVAIVVYAGSEGVALPSTRLDAEGRATVLQTLAKLESGGSTNGGAGIQRAYEMAMKEKIEGGVNRVILATDGDFNVGVTGQSSLVELVKDRAKSGVYLTVAGFGTGNLNDSMMDAITRDGNGNYFYIDSEREGRKVFLRNLTGTLVTIAKDVKIQVEFNPAKVGSYRLIGYSNRVLKNEDFNNDKVDAGDIGAGHTVTAFYELMPPGTAADGLKYQNAPGNPASSDEWLNVKLRHKHPDGNESSRIEFPLTGAALALEKTDADFQFAASVALFGMKLRGMEEVSGIGWDKVTALARAGLADDANEDRAEFVGLLNQLAGAGGNVLPNPAEVTPQGRE